MLSQPWRHTKFLGLVFAVAFLSTVSVPIAAAQGLDAAALLKPAIDTWPTYNGDYSGRRYSPLNQINAGNVRSLTLAWAFPTHTTTIKPTTLVLNGIMNYSTP